MNSLNNSGCVTAVLLDMHRVADMDYTAASALRALAKQMKKTGQGRGSDDAPLTVRIQKVLFEFFVVISEELHRYTPRRRTFFRVLKKTRR